MKSVWREKESGYFRNVAGFKMCGKCFDATMPRKPGSSIRSMVLRAPARGMIKPVDEKAEKVRRRKSKTNMTRKTFSLSMVLYCSGAKGVIPEPPRDCPKCLALNAA